MSKKKVSRQQKKALTSTGTWQRAWDSMSEVRQHVVCVFLLIVVSIGFFASIHFSSDQLIAGDTIRWRSVASDMIAYEESTGETALWATNTFGGMPGFMISYPIAIPQIDIVPNMLRRYLWPSSHMILLFLGMYILVWVLTSDKLAAVFSSVSFGLTTYIPVLLMAGHNTKFVALAWAPWLILAFVMVLRSPGWKTALLFAILAAVNLRAGHVQITYYMVIICGVWWITELISRVRSGDFKSILVPTFFLLAGTGLALLMLAHPYWAFATFKPFTIRGAAVGGVPGGLSWQYAMAWSQGFTELLTLLIANVFGGGGALYWGPKTFTAGPHYMGALTIVCAIYAFLKDRSVPVVALWASAMLMTMFALGEYLPVVNKTAFDYLPFYSTIRVPETWLSAVAMCVSILAGIGVAGAVSEFGRSDRRVPDARTWDRILVGAFAVPSVLVLTLMLAPDLFLSFEKPAEETSIFAQIRSQAPGISPDDPRVGQLISREMDRRHSDRQAAFYGDARRTVFFLVTGFILFYLMRRRKVLPWLATTGLIFLVVFDLGGVGHRYINASILSSAGSPEDAIPKFAFDDYLIQRQSEAGGTGYFRVLSLEAGSRIETNARPSRYYESLGGYSGAKLRSYQDFLDQMIFSTDGTRLNPNALAIMNVRFIVGRLPAPGYHLVFQDDEAAQSIFENPDIPDRAYFVGATELIQEPEEIWARIRDDSFDPSQAVLLTDDWGKSVNLVDSASVTNVSLIEHNNRNIIWDVETDEARWLVVSEMYYPAGWSATVDDEKADIVQANYLNRAVFIPAGQHRVSMQFNPAPHTIGVQITGITTLFVYLVLGFILLIQVRAGMAARQNQAREREQGAQ